MLVTRRFLVSGRVQGVGFRYFVQERALELGLTGWVRNLPSGHVEALAAGDGEAVASLERELKKGPPVARVERVDVHDITGQAADEPQRGFTIR
ncbi:MAG TPA: acylphosphatase [Vicinamibacterales bacterium]|jgi:acylphosphatase|nr:acylphosphatase [Vicinamibacterales bacterium]